MAMECIKNCCRSFLVEEKEPEPQIITVRPFASLQEAEVRKSTFGVSEDYLLSKLPPDGKEIPFVLPSFRSSYVQPQGMQYSSYQPGLQGSARATYAERKAELSTVGQIAYDPTSPINLGHVISYVSPRTVRRPMLRVGHASAFDQSVKQRLSASMLDLSSPHGHIQRYDSVNSVQSSTSSFRDSFGSSRSIESSTVSSDDRERDLGKVCVRLSYQEAVEQVWITLVQCKDLCVYSDVGEQQRVGFKGVITMAKPVQFKTSVKEATPDVVFMETFVFTLNLEQLHGCALVLRLQTHTPRKRTQGECVLSLRTLASQETEHWLDLSPPCKTHFVNYSTTLAGLSRRAPVIHLLPAGQQPNPAPDPHRPEPTIIIIIPHTEFLRESRDVQRRTLYNEKEDEAGKAVRRAGAVGGVRAPAGHRSGLQHPAVGQTLQPWIYTQEVPARTGRPGFRQLVTGRREAVDRLHHTPRESGYGMAQTEPLLRE
ncbi:tandem C2 domains nuclear protein isoform X1 [Ictalurus punctatus]|uniref:Tandem C2 domains nuclear protein isoform X1 n=1 Tax=Ictalurus punctatus TaxID=7998 RepID=A0A979E8I3_ICTPU|nr:tandem C2 domains nuclear protein isoform X1 [Ictalurus punctatus]